MTRRELGRPMTGVVAATALTQRATASRGTREGVVESLGPEAVQAHEAHITSYAMQRLENVPNLRILGPLKCKDLDTTQADIDAFIGALHTHDS